MKSLLEKHHSQGVLYGLGEHGIVDRVKWSHMMRMCHTITRALSRKFFLCLSLLSFSKVFAYLVTVLLLFYVGS